MKLHESGENYLENIYILQETKGRVRSIDIANAMNFSKPSVSRAVHLLEKEAYLIIEDDGHISLTERGLELAKRIYGRHVFLTHFLTSIGVSEKQAADDACRMEHVISEESLNALKKHQSIVCTHKDCPHKHQNEIFESNTKIISHK